ncbi:hypothetical protein [Phenylobacterium sp.]|uniref:hypothetical protein n=1 Tax=Phenylobacterium sp. TaxID=1871053 RepID=UPI00121F9266|nr:hypothetical protein [Phenylobacterium sp.]THD59623.1 MAG: hypothetical protein E8A12_11365 [Phenylobacterium sp.]
MKPSRWIQLVGGAAGAMAVGSAAYAQPATSDDQKLHLATSPADFAALGLGQTVAVREDGRRTRSSADTFEWWYFDGLLDDGSVVVVWFGDNWMYGSHKRAVDIELTPPGKPTRRVMRTFAAPGSFATDHADIQIGPHSFKGDLETYSIHVDPSETGGVGCDLTLRRRVASYRPATGYIEAGTRYFAWLVAVPEGAITGTLTADGATRQVTGSGYHDHNWGNVSPAKLFDDWWWGRGRSGGHTIIASEIHGKAAVGGASIPLFFVGDDTQVEVDAFGSDVTVTEGGPVRHPDARHQRPIGSGVSFATANGSQAEFKISDHLLTSANLLADEPFAVRIAASAMSMKPWYTRFESPITLSLPGTSASAGQGTLEYFELK